MRLAMVFVMLASPSLAHGGHLFEGAMGAHKTGVKIIKHGADTMTKPLVPLTQIAGFAVVLFGVGIEVVGVPLAGVSDLVSIPFKDRQSPGSQDRQSGSSSAR